MTSVFNRARILVCDDQADVARTLCAPIRQAGATIQFVEDGYAALDEIDRQPYELLVVDMKMPPGEWGGLWLLKQLRDGGWRIPAIVLSGEGTQRQTIEAMRLGAADWIDKAAADAELEYRCSTALQNAYIHGLDLATDRLPTPLARAMMKYSRAVAPDRRVVEGLRVIEAVLRFAAVVGLSTIQPHALPGVRAEQLARPSMGTWFALCTGLCEPRGELGPFRTLLSCLIPDTSARRQVQELIGLRNKVAHSGYTPDAANAAQVEELVARFAHRAAAAWRAPLAVPASMTYNGTTFEVSTLELTGAKAPKPGTLTTGQALLTGTPVLLERGRDPIILGPWAITMPNAAGDPQCLFFDGVKRTRDNAQPTGPLLYSDMSGSVRGIEPQPSAGHSWLAILPWFEKYP